MDRGLPALAGSDERAKALRIAAMEDELASSGSWPAASKRNQTALASGGMFSEE
jgi:hypothetical protein